MWRLQTTIGVLGVVLLLVGQLVGMLGGLLMSSSQSRSGYFNFNESIASVGLLIDLLGWGFTLAGGFMIYYGFFA